jgi:hypothetical protein
MNEEIIVLSVKAEWALMKKQPFTIKDETGKDIDISLDLAEKIMAFRAKLNPIARSAMDKLPVSNQLSLVDALKYFEVAKA